MKALAAALVEAQKEMPAVVADSVNPHFNSRFVSLDHLIAKTKPVLTKHGLAIVQMPSNLGGVPALATTIIHAASGESITDTVPLVLDGQNMQKLGGALTYARRYSWAAALGICDEADDDGNAASAPAPAGASQKVSTGDVGAAQGGRAAGSSPSPDSPAAPKFQQPEGTGSSVPEWTWPFGKFKGKSLADTDEGYLQWFLSNSDKEDIKQRVREHLNLQDLAATGGSFYDPDDPDSDVPF